MSFDLYRDEVDNRISSLRPVTQADPGVFDNFLAGSGQVAMQTFAKAGRAASMALAPAAIGLDKAKAAFNDTAPSTEIQDKFFKAHDEIFGRAVDYWTPKPNEVGAAGQITGQLLATLPMVMAAPAATVAATQLSVGEDLVRKGVDATKAQAVGAVQAAGLGLGIWVPILGQTLAQRVLLGGAGFNVAQGLATRAASAKLLEGTPGAEDFKALDPTALTLDVLLGAAFGGIAHINPRMRAEGEAWHKRIAEWGQNLKPSEIDALAAMRQAQHLNADSLPGKPVDVEDVNAHVARMRQAIDDLANDRPVQVEDMPAGRFDVDPARQAEAEANTQAMLEEIKTVSETDNIPDVTADITPRQEGNTNGSAGATPAVDLSFNDVMHLLSQAGDVFVRWSRGPKFDLADNAVSRDYISGSAHSGLSAVMVTKDNFADAIANVSEYGFLRMKDPAIRPHLYRGEIVGTDSDGYPVIKPNEYLGELNAHAIKAIDEHAAERLRLEEKIVDANRRLESITDAVGKQIVAETLKESQRRLEELGGAISLNEPSSQKVSPPETAAPENLLHEAAGLDPLQAEAVRFAQSNPDLPIRVGENADGSPIVTTPKQYLEDADNIVRQAQEDASLFEIAAGCLLGGGR